MNASLLHRLTEALDDERRAIAAYRGVLERFGVVRPFVHILEAECRHAAALLGLFERYGLPVPEDRWASAPLRVPTTLLEACRNGVAAEQENIAMYERLLAATEEPDVRRVRENLQAASRERHLPAFERCVARGGGSGSGRVHGRGGRRHRQRSGVPVR